jgi:hypothetical protein
MGFPADYNSVQTIPNNCEMCNDQSELVVRAKDDLYFVCHKCFQAQCLVHREAATISTTRATRESE